MDRLICIIALIACASCGTDPHTYLGYHDAGDTDSDAGSDTDSDAGIDTETETETETETNTETETETNTETETEATCLSSGGWYDDVTDLCWQNPSSTSPMTWSDAVEYCLGLDLGGHNDWRLPNINEARSIVRGCPGTVTGGVCTVTDWCLSSDCWVESCSSCSTGGGPDLGCYWPTELDGECLWYWTSSETSDIEDEAWCIAFGVGSVGSWGKENNTSMRARCVRND